MTECELLSEEITEQEAEIARLKGSMGKADNGVKTSRIKILSRTLDRLRELKRQEQAA